MEREEKSGVITVFFSLVFLLIISLIGSMLYAALTVGARSVGERVFMLAGESVLGGYYRPLYEEYHIFAKAYSGSYGVNPHQLLEEELVQWIELNLENGDKKTGVEGAGTGFFLAHSLEEVEVLEVEHLLSEDGDWLVSQAADYQKYRLAADVLNSLFQFTKELDGMSKAAQVLEKKSDAEEQYAEAAIETAELMRCIDGVKWKRKFFIFSGKGVSGATKFAKQMWTGEITPQSTGINHPVVFQAVQGKYMRADLAVQEAYLAGAEARRLANEEVRIEEEIAAIRQELYELERAENSQQENQSGQTAEERKKLRKQLTTRKAELEREQNDIASDRRQQERTADNLISKLLSQAASSLKAGEEALEIIESVTGKLKAAETAMKVFEAVFEAAKPQLDEALAAQIEKDAELLRENGGIGYDLEAAKTELKRRQTTLTTLKNTLAKADATLGAPNYTDAVSELANCCELVKELEWQGPAFDYSDYQEDTEDSDPLVILEGLLNSGIAALVMPDGSDVSEKTIDIGTRPSEWKQILPEETSEENISLGNMLAENLGSLAQTVTEKVLFVAYAREHFGNFLKPAKEKETELQYEQEYLLVGKKKDSDNLNSVIGKLVGIRLLVNLAALTVDSEARGEVEIFAEAAAAFTGIPVLKLVFISLLLLLWAAELAFVEVCAMLSGNKVPVIPDKVNRPVQFEELLIMVPSVIRKKAEQYETEQRGISAGYQDYLNLLLLVADRETMNCRGLDLIEANLQRWCDEDFRILNCICGFQASMRARVPFQFPGFAFVRRFYDSEGMEYQEENVFAY